MGQHWREASGGSRGAEGREPAGPGVPAGLSLSRAAAGAGSRVTLGTPEFRRGLRELGWGSVRTLEWSWLAP